MNIVAVGADLPIRCRALMNRGSRGICLKKTDFSLRSKW